MDMPEFDEIQSFEEFSARQAGEVMFQRIVGRI